MVPAGVPAPVQAMLVAGNELQDLPYGPLGHPDPLGATEEDCSSTVNYVLYRAGYGLWRKSCGRTRSPRTTSVGVTPAQGGG